MEIKFRKSSILNVWWGFGYASQDIYWSSANNYFPWNQGLLMIPRGIEVNPLEFAWY